MFMVNPIVKSVDKSSSSFYMECWFVFLALCAGFQYQLQKASMTEIDAFAFLKGEKCGDYMMYPAFCEALHQVCFLAITAFKIK